MYNVKVNAYYNIMKIFNVDVLLEIIYYIYSSDIKKKKNLN